MTLKGHYALCFKTRASFGAHDENLNEDRQYRQRQRCSPMTLDSDNIRFMRIFAVVLKIYVNVSLDFMLVPLYYVYTYLTLFSLSSSIVLFTTVIYHQWLRRAVKCGTSGDVASGVAKCDPQNIWNLRKKLRIFRRRYIVGILTNKANVSI